LDDDLKRIASRIRGWRDEAGLTLQQLGDQSGVSASTIHKIENLQTVPTITVLLKVANGLNRRPSELLADAEVGQQVAVLRRSERQKLRIEGRATLEHLVGMIPRNRLDVWRADLEPNIGAGIDGGPWQFHGEVILIVEDGSVEIYVEGEGYKLSPGDSVHFDSSLPHRWFASGGQTARVTVFALIPERLQGDLLSRIAMSSGIQKPSIDSTTDE
jgi:transcriptional regulator with XRE-family HTH domain